MSKDELLEIIKVKDKEIEGQDKIIIEINKTKYDKLMEKDVLFHLKNRNEELEAKLTEKEKAYDLKYKHWIEEIRESNRLREELAEKTLTIERINKAFIENRSLWKSKYERANQDKISFALEQLEKVKEFFLKEHRDEEMDTDYLIIKDAGEIAEYLLDQIEELKKE